MGKRCKSAWVARTEDPPVSLDPTWVIDMENAAAAPQELLLERAGRRRGEPCRLPQRRPGAVARVDLLRLQPRRGEVGGKRNVLSAGGEAAKLFDARGPPRRHRLPDVLKDNPAGDRVELHVATGRQKGEARVDLPFEILPRPPEEGPEAPVVAKLLAVLADEVEHRADRLPIEPPQTAAELLEEEGGAVGGPQKEDRVDRRHVDPLVEEVDREHDVYAPALQIVERRGPFGVGRVGPDGRRLDARLVENPGHEAGMGDADTKSETANLRRVCGTPGELLKNDPSVGVVGGEYLREALDVIAGPTPPGDIAQIGGVVDAVVDKRREAMLVNRIPEPQLRRDPIAEPAEHRQAVAPLRRGGEAEELPRRHMLEQPPVGRRRRMMKLIDDDNVEVVAREMGEPRRVEALDRGKNMLESLRPRSPHPQLAERRLAEGVPEGAESLREDLLPMGDEQQPGPRERGREAAVVDRRHHGLSCPGRGGQEIAVMPLRSRQGDSGQEIFLEGLEANLDRAEQERRSRAGRLGLLEKLLPPVGKKRAALPVALEHRGELVDRLRIPRPRQANIPLQAAHLGRVGEIRGADVGG